MTKCGQQFTLTSLCLLFGALFLALGACRNATSDQTVSTAEAPTIVISTAATPATTEPEHIAQRTRPPATYTTAPTMTSGPTVTAVPLPSKAIDLASQFGESRNQLTGELVEDPLLLQRRPIAVKISNAPARWTRPQAGLSQADLVFEHLTEGSITRFTAILYGSTPLKVGPIRSARLIDLEILAMYDAALAFSGSSIGVSRKLFSSDFQSRILRTNTPGYYRTGEDKPYEHTLYATPVELWETLTHREENREPYLNSVMTFSLVAPEGGVPATWLTVRYRSFSTVDWRFDEDAGRYFRWVDGEEHTDANDYQQIRASNVVILVVPHRQDDTICEYQVGDHCQAFSTEVQLWGEGQALVLRDGQAYDVIWRRNQRHELLTFLDEERRPFPLQMGNTWFQIIPTDYAEAYSIGSLP